MQDGSIKIIKQISIGGWSAVYLVQEANTRLRVLKEAALPLGARAELKAKAEAMFGREAELLLKLDHPNIVKVYKHFEEGGRQYLLLDYINGTNLRQLVKASGALHRLDVIDYAASVLDILQYLHGLSPPLIHRDITPENLVITGTGDLKLIDFGAANELLGTATGTMVGKQCYMPIEQFKGKATIKSDLYALGASMYFMYTGLDPEPLKCCQIEPRGVVADAEGDLLRLIAEMTAQDAEQRPSEAIVKQRLMALRR